MAQSERILWIETTVKLKELKDYDINPRRINTADFKRLVNDIKQDGYHRRILVSYDNVIIGGHSRKKALLAAGFREHDDIHVLKPNRLLSEEELKRLNIRDNLGFGDWDMDMLANNFDMDDLKEWGMPDTMFDPVSPEIEIAEDEDEIVTVDINNQPITKQGDIWLLGDHRLMCGDSTVATTVESLMDGISPILMVTDPPYGVQYDASWRENGKSKGKVLNDDRIDWSEAYSLFNGDIAYIWHSSKYTHLVTSHLEICGYKLINQIIWVKQHFVLSRGDYHWQHEPCLYMVKKDKKHNWQGARDQSTVWEIKNNNFISNSDKEETMGHSTQKPIECMLKPVLNNTKEEDYVYDPFGGSGTTLIACEKSNRKCLMMELSPHYCDVIVKRWEKLSGKKAMLSSETNCEYENQKTP
ncbi:COG0863 DNA modification methylase [uncultured Caudovirales phage]|uniref:COG0863 DNA modification methylase n=1 Tax=uncultured Caudovirales phage TaxID=2100421 RepID=A0A6J5PB45_9CAUD|nr:COG0863 DNA modification methylase [uncultured Caudovirales phage]CAB4176614.1 COG0863 DNA modification methylase [uncultured Caudovirales phage]CAB4181388.1 COG0863 DNA modification methylase [uncultured Caudovirales phage]CAB4197820.1 COG0863 DNA modification methylase [uncultured Caudovirales phage]CAB4210821.1 COG0863 DNA modification methylase [uncultured Caudovirales phage]